MHYLIWVFITFLYYKIALDMAFYSNATVLASLLLSIVLVGFIFVAAGIYSIRMYQYNAQSLLQGFSITPIRLVKKTLWQFVGVSIAYLLAARLVVFGFSKRLNEDIELLTYRDNISEEFIIFSLVITVPLLIHYAMCLFAVWTSFQEQQSVRHNISESSD